MITVLFLYRPLVWCFHLPKLMKYLSILMGKACLSNQDVVRKRCWWDVGGNQEEILENQATKEESTKLDPNRRTIFSLG